jgi:cytochrome b561
LAAAGAVRYTGFAILLHWVVALLMVAGFIMGLTMVGMRFSPAKLKFFSWHKWIGFTVFLFALVRLLWRLGHPAPPLPATLSRLQRIATGVSHVALYVLMLIIPLSGWTYSSASGIPVVYLGVLPLPDLVGPDKSLEETLKTVHHTLNWILLALVTGHVAAALKHQFVDHDTVLARMLPWRRTPPLAEGK